MSRISLNELVRSWPVAAHVPEVVKDQKIVCVEIAAQVSYVAPDVECDFGEDEPAAVVLITAPGAAGKSRASRWISKRVGGAVIDLSQMRVGSKSIVGAMATAFGFGQAGALLEDVRAGDGMVILDALDEAFLRSGQANFDEFLNDVPELVNGESGKVQFLAMGRSDAIEYTKLHLTTLGVRVAVYSLCELTRPQVYSLIELTLDEESMDGRPFRLHRTAPVPFSAARDSLLRNIAWSLGSEHAELSLAWTECSEFLGYAPVVVAAAKQLVMKNYSNAPQWSPTEPMSEGRLLLRIMTELIDRESGKVQQALGTELALDETTVSVLYAAEEQCMRVLEVALGLGGELHLEAPAHLPDDLREIYVSRVRAFAAEHPFVSNGEFAGPIFRDYMRARLATSPVEILSDSFSTFDLTDSMGAPGPFFVKFMSALAIAGSDRPAIESAYVGDIIASARAASRGLGFCSVETRANIATLHVYGDRSVGLLDEEGASESFEISDWDGILTLVSPVANIMVVGVDGIVVGQGGGVSVEVGPSVILQAREIQFSTKQLNLSAVRKGDVMLFAEKLDIQGNSRVACATPEGFKVYGPSPFGHPWNRYQQESSKLTETDWIVARNFQKIVFWVRRLLSTFKGGAAGSPVAHRLFVKNVIVNQNKLGLAVLSRL